MRIFFFLILLSFSSLGLAKKVDVKERKVLMDIIIQDNEERTFSLHKPNYVLAGENDLKLQFSFKYRVFKKTPLFFDFTQRLFWDIYKDSKPFRDINYHPGLFYRFVIKDKRLKSIDLGYLHSSNGKAGLESRSVDQIYMRNSFLFSEGFLDMMLSLELFYNFNLDQTNEGIDEYMGYYRLNLFFIDLFGEDEWRFGLRASGGKRLIDFHHGYVSANLIYRIPDLSFNPDLFIQYYYGHLENLLEYTEKKKEIRAGLLFYY